MTFADDLEAVAAEPIEAIVIGDMGWTEYNEENKSDVSHVRYKLISWPQARPLLEYEYDSDYGAPDCHAITIWTANYIVFVSQYDGATAIERLPRNPIQHTPIMSGG